MAFTYDVTTPTYYERIRYAIGDTVSATAIYSDEEIDFVYGEESSSVGATVVSLIENIIVKLAHEPDMEADWLKVDWRRSEASWFKLLSRAKQKYGLGAQLSSGGQHAYRADSYQDESPDWDSIYGNLDDD